MEIDIVEFAYGQGIPIRYSAYLQVDDKEYVGEGLTEETAVLDVLAKAAEESSEARYELGIVLGQRQGGQGGRPNGSRDV